MPFDPQGINPEDVATPDPYQGPGMAPQGAPQVQLDPRMQALLAAQGQGQLPPGPLTPPAVQPPDMSQLMAEREKAIYESQPHTGRSNPTVLNQEQYTQAGLENLEARKGITKQQGDVLQNQYDQEAQIQSQAAAEQKLRLLNDELAHQKAMRDGKERDDALMSAVQTAAQEKIDPNHWWNSKTTAGKVQASIGMFLNGLGDPRLAHEQMNKAIDRDIEAQHENISNHWKAIANQAGIGDRADLRAAHDIEYRNQFRIASLEVVKQQLAAAAAGGKASMVAPNAQMAIMDINKQQDDLRKMNYDVRQKMLANQYAGQAALRKRLDEMTKEAAAHQVALMNGPAPLSEAAAHQAVGRMYPELVQYGLWGGSKGGMATEAPQTQAEKTQQRVEEKDLESRSVTLPQGGIGVARDAAAAKDYTERVAGTKNWMQKFTQVQALQEKYKNGTLTTEDIGKWEALNADLTNTMNSTFAVTRQAGIGEGERIAGELLPKPPGAWYNRAYNHQYDVVGANQEIKANDGKVAAVNSFMPERVKQAMADLTPLNNRNAPPGAASGAEKYAELGFKPTGKPAPKGMPQAIPTIQDMGGAKEPGIPTWQQYNRNK